MMKIRTAGALIAACLLTTGSAVAAPTYLPSGPQANVSLSTITSGGWTQCYSGSMGAAIGNAGEVVLAPCQGDYLMMAGRRTGADTFLSLAAALRSDTILDTGNTSNTHLANGSQWWFSDFWSWGFTEANDTVQNGECDVGSSPLSMCLHTLDFTGGYRINDFTGLNNSQDFEKIFFVANANAVPEPGALSLLGLALAGVVAVRRRKNVASSHEAN